jgi:hypothetical protein
MFPELFAFGLKCFELISKANFKFSVRETKVFEPCKYLRKSRKVAIEQLICWAHKGLS